MNKQYDKLYVDTRNLFASAVMPPVGPHDTDAVLAERIKRAFAVADLMLVHSLTYCDEQPVSTMQGLEDLETPATQEVFMGEIPNQPVKKTRTKRPTK